MSADRSGRQPEGSRTSDEDRAADEWGVESFPASDPPENWAGQDRDPRSGPEPST